MREWILFSLMAFCLPSLAQTTDLIGVRRVQLNGQATNYGVQSIADMMKTGVVAQYSSDPDEIRRDPPQSLDLNAGDDLTKAMADIQKRVEARLAKSPSVKALFVKSEWDMKDRIAWEKEFALTLAEERHHTPGLDAYRSTGDSKFHARVRSAKINDLSKDIHDNTAFFEFDCEQMTAVDGIIMQKIEDGVLPAQSPSLKKAAPYIRATGLIYMELDTFLGQGDPMVVGNHVFLISSLTGNIIESTANPFDQEVVYRSPMKPWKGVEAYLSGENVLIHDEGKYILYTSLLPEKDAYAKTIKAAQVTIGEFKKQNYLDSLPKLIAVAEQDRALVMDKLNAYRNDPRIAKVKTLLASATTSLDPEKTQELRDTLSNGDIRGYQDEVKTAMEHFRFRVDSLRYVEHRLQAQNDKVTVQKAIADVLAPVQESLNQTIFDVEVVSSSADSQYVVREKLSGKSRLNRPVGSVPPEEAKPSVRAVNATEDINIPLNEGV